ncbi:MAG: CHAT domain-containing protein [Gemmatimonadetes bacterium]|nr:CHAT domain-containing protein [Gemmatimonadota bacterium]
MPRATLLRVGPAIAGAHTLSLYEGDEADVLARAASGAAADASATLVAPFADPFTAATPPAGVTFVPLADARALLASADGLDNTLRDLGLQLYATLAQGDVGARWQAARKAAAKLRLTTGVHLRTWLDVQDEALARLPWEVMRDGIGGGTVALEEWSTLVRLGAGAPPALAESMAALRVLFVVGCHPTDDANIAWLDEQRAFLATVCPRRTTIDFEVFEAHARSQGGLKANLRRAIEAFRPHVLHFVGHGRIDAGDAALELFDSSTGQRVPWTAQEFNTALAPHPPRLVVLNACRTSAQNATADAPIAVLATMADAAVAAGAAAVVAMQHDVAGRAAALFAEALYSALADGAPIDSALVRGRKRIGDDLGFADANWALPVCTLNVPPDEVLPQPQAVGTAVLPDDAMRTYVGRRMERRAVAAAVAGAGQVVRFVAGESEMGKSTMARLVAEWRLLLGHRVVLLDCAQATGGVLDALAFMRHLRGANVDGGPLRPNLYADFALFNDTANAAVANRPREAVPATGIDDGKPLDRAHFAERGWEQLGAAFIEGLRTASATQPLTLVIDHLARNNAGVDVDDFRQHIVPQLLLPLHRGDAPNVSVVICGSDAQFDACGLRALREASRAVAQLGEFLRVDWELLAREFAIRADIPAHKADMLITALAPTISAAWHPSALLAMRQFYRAL